MKDDETAQTLCKTLHQYNRASIHMDDMKKFLEIAEDYRKVKNQVYQRYGGIKGLLKIYPGYTVQNEMTGSGLRAQLGLPSVYFYLAVFEALGDIKTQWTQVKNEIQKSIQGKTDFSPDDCHYIRFVLRIESCFKGILLKQAFNLPEKLEQQYQALCIDRNTDKLNSYVQRQVRNRLNKLHADSADGFGISERAYRYADHGIYISVKEKRKRIFVPLTDNNSYKRQLYIRLYPEMGNIEIHVPVDTKVKQHPDYTGTTGLALGMFTMLTTDEGHMYGERYGEYQQALSKHIGQGGREKRMGKKYRDRKEKLEAALHTYVNQEINRLIREEKPGILLIPKLPQNSKAGMNRTINRSVSLWQRGFIRKRIRQKAVENSIQVIEVFAKNISGECSCCGGEGLRREGIFYCGKCGTHIPDRTNAARNALQRGIEQHKAWEEGRFQITS